MTRFLLAAAASVCLPGGLLAAHWGPYNEKDFTAAQKAGQVVLLQFTGAGCGVCVEQDKVLSRVLWGSPRRDLWGFQVDFDHCGDLCGRYQVTGRSAMIVFKGAAEVARNTGVMLEDEVTSLIQKATPPEPRGRPRTRPRTQTPPRP